MQPKAPEPIVFKNSKSASFKAAVLIESIKFLTVKIRKM